MKTWIAGEQVNAPDLNGNFTEAVELGQPLTAGESLTANNAGYISPFDSKVYNAHGFKANTNRVLTLPTSFYDTARLNATQYMILSNSTGTLTLSIKDKSGAGTGDCSATVTTTFQYTGSSGSRPSACVVRMTDSTFMVFYSNSAFSDKLYYRSGSVSGTTITMDTATAYPSVGNVCYAVHAMNGNSNKTAVLMFSSQPSGIGSGSTDTMYLKYLAIDTNSLTETYSTNLAHAPSSFFPMTYWSVCGLTENGIALGIVNFQNNGGYASFATLFIDTNDGTTGVGDIVNPIQQQQGANRFSSRPVSVVHDNSLFFCYKVEEAGTNITIDFLNLFRVGINQFQMYTINGIGASVTGADSSSVVPLVGGYHGFVICNPAPPYAFYRFGKFYNFPKLTNVPNGQGQYVNGSSGDELVYTDGANVTSDYMTTIFDGIIASSVSSNASVVLYRNFANAMSLTANKRYYLKDGYTNAGEIQTRGTIPIGRSVSTTAMILEK